MKALIMQVQMFGNCYMSWGILFFIFISMKGWFFLQYKTRVFVFNTTVKK